MAQQLITLNQVIAQTRSFAPLVEGFLNDLDIKQNSKATYLRALEKFFIFCLENSVSTPQRQDILKYKQQLISSGLTPYTITNYLVVVRKFFDWASAINGMAIYSGIARGIKGMKRPNGFSKDCLTVGQVKNLLSLMPKQTLQEKRDFAIVNIFLRTGLRTIELQRANIEDFRQCSGVAKLFIQGKGRDSKDSFVVLTEASVNPLYSYLNARERIQDNAPLFVSTSDRNNGQRLTTRTLSSIAKTALKQAGLNSSRLTAHSLRHTAITSALLGGASLQETKELARHTDINTTLIYSHNLDRVKNAAEKRIDELYAA